MGWQFNDLFRYGLATLDFDSAGHFPGNFPGDFGYPRPSQGPHDKRSYVRLGLRVVLIPAGFVDFRILSISAFAFTSQMVGLSEISIAVFSRLWVSSDSRGRKASSMKIYLSLVRTRAEGQNAMISVSTEGISEKVGFVIALQGVFLLAIPLAIDRVPGGGIGFGGDCR